MQIKAIIFDMGGVLLKTVNPSPREALARAFGTTRTELEKVVFLGESSKASEIGELSDADHWQMVFDHFGQKIENYRIIYDQFFGGDAIDRELLAFAGSLSPEYKIGLLSNAWVNARILLKKRFDFLDVFDHSIFSYEVGCRKPDPKIFQEMVNRLDVQANESLFIDDFIENVEGAEKFGMQAIHFRNTQETIRAVKKRLSE